MEVSGQLHATAASSPEKKTGTHWIGLWMGPRFGLDVLEKRKSLTPAEIRNYDLSGHSVVTIRTTPSHFFEKV